MTEPQVALTDYALMFECLAFAWMIGGIKTPQRLSKWSIVTAFLGLGLASLAGGTVHGFFNEETSVGFKLLWPATLLCIGVVAFACWIFALPILFAERFQRTLQALVCFGLAIYGVVILFFDQRFKIAILFYLPAAILLFMATCRIYFKERILPAAAGILGILVALIAPVLQQRGISWPFINLNHNALYHLLQGLSNALVFWAAHWFLQKKRAV